VGFVGSLKPWHGIDTLLLALRDMSGEPPHLLIVGEGPMREWIEEFVHSANMNNRVTLTGWVDNQSLPSYIQAMDIAVAPYPAMDDFYFSPLKLFEYLAMGVPVVASSLGQVNKIVKHNVNGLLCQAGDVRDLTEKLRRLADDPDLRKTMSKHAVDTAGERTWRCNAMDIIDIVTPLVRAA